MVAYSIARVRVSPTTEPIDPIMKVRSRHASIADRPLMKHVPAWHPSICPVFFCSASIRSGYALRSTNSSGSAGRSSVNIGVKVSASAICSIRVLAEIR